MRRPHLVALLATLLAGCTSVVQDNPWDPNSPEYGNFSEGASSSSEELGTSSSATSMAASSSSGATSSSSSADLSVASSSSSLALSAALSSSALAIAPPLGWRFDLALSDSVRGGMGVEGSFTYGLSFGKAEAQQEPGVWLSLWSAGNSTYCPSCALGWNWDKLKQTGRFEARVTATSYQNPGQWGFNYGALVLRFAGDSLRTHTPTIAGMGLLPVDLGDTLRLRLRVPTGDTAHVEIVDANYRDCFLNSGSCSPGTARATIVGTGAWRDTLLTAANLPILAWASNTLDLSAVLQVMVTWGLYSPSELGVFPSGLQQSTLEWQAFGCSGPACQ